MGIRVPFLCSITLYFLSQACFGQCGYSPTIHTNKDYCVGSLLIAASTHALQNIVWYKNGQPVKSVNGTQSLATQPVDFQFAKNSLLSGLREIATDDAGNLYVLDDAMQQVFKLAPGLGSSPSIIAGPNLSLSANEMVVDGPGNVFLMNGDSGIGSGYETAFVTEYPAGGDSLVVLNKPVGQPYAYGSAYGMTIDCQRNFYFLSLTPYITQYSPGATSAIVVMTNANVSVPCGLEVGWRIRKDRAGNLFFISGTNVQRLAPGSNTPVAVTTYDCHANPLFNVTDFWLDANDTLYVNTEINGTGTAIVYKWAPGASTGEPIINWKAVSPSGWMPITMDVRGNIFLFDNTGSGVVEFRRASAIDSAYTPTDTGAYYAVVTDIQGYPAYTDTIHINSPAGALPSIRISASATSTPVCTPISFTAGVQDAVDPGYQWMVSGVPAGGDSTTYSYNLFSNGDQVYCILSAEGGCTGLVKDTSNVIDLSIDPQGAASVTISANRDTVCKGTPITFTATVLNGSNNPIFEWLLMETARVTTARHSAVVISPRAM
jgi:hypothetical protein